MIRDIIAIGVVSIVNPEVDAFLCKSDFPESVLFLII